MKAAEEMCYLSCDLSAEWLDWGTGEQLESSATTVEICGDTQAFPFLKVLNSSNQWGKRPTFLALD